MEYDVIVIGGGPAGLYRDQVVAVCGGGDAGLIEAMYLARFASKVFVIEAEAQLATDVPGAFAVGDIRSGSPRQVAAAVADGKAAARGAQKIFETLQR